MSRQRELELVFKHAGGVEVCNGDDVLWSSDTSPEFTEEFGSEILSAADDSEAVMDWLVDNEVVTDDEADNLRIYEDSLDGNDLEEEDDSEGMEN